MKKLILLFSVGLFLTIKGKSQGSNPMIPPPQWPCDNFSATQFLPFNYSFSQGNRSGNANVNYYNGQSNVSIPLYTIKEGDLELPITLNYNADGIKVGQNSGYVGLGFEISVGGSLTRTIKDLADGHVNYRNTNLDALNFLPYDYSAIHTLMDLGHDGNDNEYDEFSYSFPGGSGRYAQDPLTGTTILKPYKPYKISGGSDQVDIYDEKGTRYRYGLSIDGLQWASTPFPYDEDFRLGITDIVSGENPNRKIALKYNAIQPHYLATNKYLTGRYLYEDDFDYLNDYVSCDSWHWDNGNYVHNLNLSKFQDYIPYPFIQGSLGQGGYFEDNSNNAGHFYPFNYVNADVNNNNAAVEFLPSLPYEIDFSQGHVNFVLNSSNNNMLDRIEIYNLQNELIQKISFNIGQFVSSDNNYKALKSIKFQTASGTTISEYKFDYNINSQNVNFGKFPDRQDATAIDYWGYYNGKITNTNLVPNFTQIYPYTPFPIYLFPVFSGSGTPGGADRSPDENYLKTYVLNKITYPEGGYTTFDYEQNMAYSSATNITETGSGLRIKSINNYTVDGGLASKKRYEYPEGKMDIKIQQDLYSFSNKMYLVHGWYSDGQLYTNVEDNYRRSTFTPFANTDLTPKGSSVVYPKVMEYTSSTYYDLAPVTYTFDYAPTTFGTYKFPRGPYYDNHQIPIVSAKFVDAEKPWLSGNILSKEEGNVITAYEYDEVLHGTLRDVIQNRFVMPQYGQCPPWDYHGTDEFDERRWNNNNEIVFDVAYHYHIAGEKRLKAQTQTYMGQNGHDLTTTTHFYYTNDQYDQVTSTTAVNSKGQTITDNKTYAWNTTNSNSVYAIMVNKHMISQTIQEDKTLNNNAIESSKTDYKDWGNNIILPEKVWTKEGSGNWIERVRYDYRDGKGNPLQITTNGTSTSSYTYDYKQQYAVATTQNATSAEVAYTSFEGAYSAGNDVNLGKWELANVGDIVSPGFTGNKAFKLLNGGGWTSASSLVLITGKKYVLSYWKQDNSGDVYFNGDNQTSLSFTQGASVNGWTYYQSVFTAASTGSGFWKGAGNAIIDELRLRPLNAQMETSTYKPLVGITSKCDARNIVTYFEYDDFGRQVQVKDMYGNILKKTDYATQQSE